MKTVGPGLVALSLFIRDRAAQSVADQLVLRLGIGPFAVATGLLRGAAVLQAATITSRIITGEIRMGSVLDVAMAGVFCLVCVVWARETARAARRPPRSGTATASALRRDDYLVLIVLIVAFLLWDLLDLMRGSSFTDGLTTGSDLVQGVGFLLGSTLWRDLPRSRRRFAAAVPSAT